MRPASRSLHIITSLAVGGAQRHLLELLPGLGAPEAMDLIYFRDHDLRDAFRPHVRSLRHVPMAGPAGFLRLGKLARAIRTGAYGLVHTHLVRADMYGALAARMAGLRHVVSTKHNVERRLEGRLWRELHGRTNRLAERTICISDAVRRWAVEIGVPVERTRVVRYGLDPEPFSQVDRQAARAALNLTESGAVVVCPARLDPQKNHPMLLRAFAAVVNEIPTATLLLAGGRQLGSPGYESKLHALAGELDLSGRVRWLGVRDDMPQIFAAADVVTLASDWEGLGLALMEAMAAGRPVVATQVGGVPEVVADGVTGALVAAGDDRALGAELTSLLRDQARARAWGAAGAHRATEEFSLGRMHAATRAVYAEVISGAERMPGT